MFDVQPVSTAGPLVFIEIRIELDECPIIVRAGCTSSMQSARWACGLCDYSEAFPVSMALDLGAIVIVSECRAFRHVATQHPGPVARDFLSRLS